MGRCCSNSTHYHNVFEVKFMEIDIREPKQKRSIEKKEKIIKTGFQLITKNGYYNTNTAQIAKCAGVSTGIVYQYFKDKHDIFIAGINKYGDEIFYPMLKFNDKLIENHDFSSLVSDMINTYIKDHKLSKNAHEEIMSMVHSDKDVADYFYKREMDLTNKIYDILKNNEVNIENLKEKVHIIIGMIDNLCHEVVYHKHKSLNYKSMKNIVINNINNLLNEK